MLRFGEYTLDVERRSLTKSGRELVLRPQAMELLCFLVKNPGRPISKDEIFAEIWPGLYVTDDSLVQCIRDIRRSLGDDDHQIIKTVPRRGYLFACPPTQSENAPSQSSQAVTPEQSRTYGVKLALAGAAGVLLLWAIVHWFVTGH